MFSVKKSWYAVEEGNYAFSLVYESLQTQTQDITNTRSLATGHGYRLL